MRSLATQLLRQLPAPSDLRTDGDLLASFLARGTEDDFAELVRRHGPLVWGVCRRVLPDPADAEDAFQGTFLVLVRRGRKLTSYPTIGPWLHRVAVWTARNVRRRNARWLAKQSPLSDRLQAPYRDPDLPLDIDAALLSLPEKFRASIVLCHLLGFSRADAAVRLGCPEGTLSAWLSRGLARLRTKLNVLDPAKPLGLAAVGVPTGLATSAVRAAVASRVAVAATAAVSSTVSQLVDGVIRMFWIKKATAASAALFAVFAFGVGIGLSGHQVVGVAEGQEKTAGTRPTASADPPAADTEKGIAVLEQALRTAEEKHKLLKQVMTIIKNNIESARKAGATPDDDKLVRCQKDVDRAAEEVKALKDKLDKLTALKLEVDAKLKGQPTNLADVDKRIDELKKQRSALEVEADVNKRMQTRLTLQLADLQTQRAELLKQPAAKEQDHSRVEVVIGGKELGIPILYYECDKTSARVGGAKVEGEELLIRMLVRARTDPTAPKTLFIVAWDDAPDDLIDSTLRACQAAGYKEAIINGRVPTNRPGMSFKPPAKDRGGIRDGWFQADEVRVKFDELLKPLAKPVIVPKR